MCGGCEVWMKRQEERLRRETTLDEEQWNQGTELERLLKEAGSVPPGRIDADVRRKQL